MHAILRRALAALSACSLVVAAAAQAPALKGLDPVALCGGEELAGKAELSTRHGSFTYQFATAANLATFRAEPERYEIQLGGACARMGPLSGSGDAQRFHVHDGRIYIFASDQCREGFKKRGSMFLDADVPAPQPTPAQVADGERLLARAIAAHGGAERLRSWRSYQHDRELEQDKVRQRYRTLLQLPDRLRIDHDYFEGDKVWHFANAIGDDRGYFVNGFSLVSGKAEALHASACREMRQVALREPLFALRAAAEHEHVAAGRDKAKIADVDVERFDLWQNGCTTTFGVDAAGRMRTAQFRGRGPGLWFGDVVLVFDDFTTVGGLLVPQAVRATFDGADAPSMHEQRTKIEVDHDLPADTFVMPK